MLSFLKHPINLVFSIKYFIFLQKIFETDLDIV